VTEGTREQNQGVRGRSSRAAALLAWTLVALSVAMFLASVALYVLARSAQVPSSLSTDLTVSGLLVFVPFLAFPIVGALITSRRPQNPIGWICLADGLLWMLTGMVNYYSLYGVARPGSVPYPVAIGTLGNQWLWVPTVGLLGIYLLLLFPDGRLPSGRWRPLAWFSGVLIVLLSVAGGLAPGPLENQGGVPNPFGLEGHPWLADAVLVMLPLLPLCILVSAVSLVLRFRRSGGEVRQQIKWIAFVASFAGVVYLSLMVSSLIFFIFAPEMVGGGGRLAPPPLWVELLFSVAALSFAGIPVAIGFAVLKYRLYDIDVVINRTLVYGSLTALLALVYFGGVAATEAIFRTLTGQEHQPQLAIVISTLVIAALFNPLRHRIQAFIDRRFYRRKYDARKTLEAFSARLRDETDLNALSDDLVGVVRETMQPTHVSVWLRPDSPTKGSEAPE
jgi:hypothetical protein